MSEIGDRLRRLFEEIAPRPEIEGMFSGEAPMLHRQRSRLLVAAALFSVVVVTTGVLLLVVPGSDRAPDAATTLPIAASTTSLPATTITYLSPSNDDLVALVPDSIECIVGALEVPCAEINDQNPFTAWSVAWDDDLPIITMSFGETVTVSGVALQNLGDRLEFLRRSRIRQIELTTDEGGSVLVDFEDSNLDGNGVSVSPLTGSVFTIHVLAVYSPQVGYGPQDFPALPEIAVAELQLGGRFPAESETGSQVTGWAGEWSQVNVDPTRRGRSLDLAFNGESFALMTRMAGGNPVAWESDDGLVWVEAAEWDSDVLVGPLSFSSRGGGWVAAGSAGGRATVWRSWMGWDSVTVDGGPDSSWSAIASIVEWRGRLVAAGEGTFGVMPPEDVVAAAWYSDDAGASWHRSDVPDGQMLSFDSLVAGPAGILGLASDHSSFWWPVLYRSFDGISWERITPIGLETSFVVQIFADSLGYLLHDPNFGKVWSSVDAVHWVASDLPSRTPDGGEAVGFTTVARYQGAVVLTGIELFEDRAVSNARSPIAISQVDGGWVMASLDVPAGVHRLVAGNDRLVMAGALPIPLGSELDGVPEEGATLYVTAFVFRPDDQPEALPCTDRTPPLTDQDLPAAVAETRRAIYQAAIDCDWASLRSLTSDPDFFANYDGLGFMGSPIDYWIGLMRDGEDVLGLIAAVLSLPPTEIVDPDGNRRWYWPRVSVLSADQRTAADWEGLRSLYDDERIARMRSLNSYVGGFYLAIRSDGTWEFAGTQLT
ncbi:MAG: sialidase family protein [Acidimicrobiia bacterium]